MSEKKKINLPNKLTIMRMVLVPFVCALILYQGLFDSVVLSSVLATALFIIAAVTDFIDGKLARKYDLITNFGKFMDPVADKFMVIGSLICITVVNEELRPFMVWVSLIVAFRELAITSLRLIISGSGVVLAAKWLGKCKTMTQCITIVILLLHPAMIEVIPFWSYLSYIGMAATAILTIWSAYDYFHAFKDYIDPTK